MIEWIWPWAFLLAPLPWLVRRWAGRTAVRQSALTVPDLGAFQLEEAGTVADVARFPWLLAALWIVWLCLVTAAARPQWTGDPVQLPTTGRDLMLAVDISGSMSQEDMQLNGQNVNRLVVVKTVVNDFVDKRKGDRVGLILFGTQAYLQAPLTFDLTTVNRLLAEAPVGIAGGKTAIGDAIGLAVKRLRQRPESQRVLILLTDGANNVGEVAPLKAAELAAGNSIRIYTIGVGAESMRVPGLFGNFGSRVVNPSADLDEETLTGIARQTGGQYYRARDTGELARIYQVIDELEPVEQEAETFRPIAALFHWPLAAAFCVLFAALILNAASRWLPGARRGA